MSATLTDVALYLRRLGHDQPPAPTLATLRALQARHTAAFPFETLSTLLRLPVPLDPPSIERKLLHDGRGGYCYELNRLFLALLHTLGFDARAIAARVLMGEAEDAVPARTHLLVLATVDGERHVVDVGFGGMVPTAPLRLDTEAVKSTTSTPCRRRWPGNGADCMRSICSRRPRSTRWSATGTSARIRTRRSWASCAWRAPARDGAGHWAAAGSRCIAPALPASAGHWRMRTR